MAGRSKARARANGTDEDIGDTVQVASSNTNIQQGDKPADTHDNGSDRADSDEETDDEDLDTSTARGAHTPATSLPTGLRKTTGTIKETPTRLKSSRAERHSAHASADAATSSAQVPDDGSPLAKKGDPQVPVSVLAPQLDDDDEAEALFSDSNPRSSSKKTKTYGKRDRKAGAGSHKRTLKFSSLDAPTITAPNSLANKGSEDNAAADIGDQIMLEDNLPEVPTTSQAIRTSQVADEAASRSIRGEGNKRKRTEATEDDDDDKDDNEPPTTRKRTKRGKKDVEPSSDTIETDSPSPKPQPQKRVRPSKASRQSTTETQEDIVVAPRRFTSQVKPTQNRATQASSSSTSALTGKAPKVLLSQSNVAKKQKMLNFLKGQGARIVEEVPSAGSNFICVTSVGGLGTTAKLIRTIALNKHVVTDDWVVQSQAAGHLLDPSDYIHPDLAATANTDRHSLFQGKTLFFTHSLYRKYGAEGWASIEALAKDAGAARVEQGTARKGLEVTPRDEVIFFGSGKGDLDAISLMESEGKDVFLRDMLTQSVLRGRLLVDDDEFKFAPEPVASTNGRGKSKKSGKKG